MIPKIKLATKFLDISIGCDFLKFDAQKQGNKSKTKHMGLHQTMKLLYSKDTINKTKRQLSEWEKIFANHITDKG